MDENDTVEEVTEEAFPEYDPDTQPEPDDPVAPCRAVREEQKNNTSVIAEHDELLADVLYEITVSSLEE